MKRLKRPLNPQAVRKANEAIYPETQGRKLTSDIDDAELRKKWRDAYIEEAGEDSYVDTADQTNIHSSCVPCESEYKDKIKLFPVWVPETDEMLLFESGPYTELLEEHEYWENLTKNLREAVTEPEITKAKDDLAEALTGQVHINKHGSNRSNGAWNVAGHFIEGVLLKQKKFTYVRSEKMKNHRRSYKVKPPEGLFSNGKLNKKGIQNRFGAVEKKIKTSFQDEYECTIGGADTFLGKLNQSMRYELDKDRKPEDVIFDVSAGAQLLRFYGGASLNFGYDPTKGNVCVEGALSAKLSIAEGIVRTHAYMPSEAGHDLIFKLLTSDKQCNLGAVRAMVELTATGFIGASACGSLAIKVETTKATTKRKTKKKDTNALPGLRFKGADLKDDDNAPVTVSGQLFAGLEAGGDLAGSMQWENPEESEWKTFIKIGYGLTASYGIGLVGEFRIGFDKGRFVYKARAGLCFGLGASGAVIGEVDARSIYQCIQFIYHKLKDSDFSYLEFIETIAFTSLTMLLVTSIELNKKAEELVCDLFEDVDDWWKERRERKDKVENLAERINNNPEILKFTTPEAKGMMLYTLTERFIDSFEEKQEDAVIKILERIQTLNDFHHVLEHITEDGSACDRERGQFRLNMLLDGRQSRRAWRIKAKLVKESQKTKTATVQDLFPLTASVNTPVKITPIA